MPAPHLRRRLAGLALAMACSCAGPRPWVHAAERELLPEAAQPATRSAPPLQPVLPSGPLAVRIESADGLSRLELTRPNGARVVIQRAGDLALASGGQAGKRIELTGPLEYQGHTYPGRLLAEPAEAGGLRLTNLVNLEDYVAGVVAAELSLWSAQPAELQAQAIAVRTYALRALAVRGGPGVAKLVDGVQDQAYRGTFQPGASRGAQRAATRLQTAVAASRGQVLVEAGELADVRYHAACGGRTANRARIFPGAVTSAPRPCAPCSQRDAAEQAAGAPDPKRPLGWTLELGPSQLADLGQALELGAPVLSLAAAEVDEGGRWLRARVTTTTRSAEVPTEAIRAALGHAVLKSAKLTDVQVTPTALRLRGVGRGHGVGLCQESCRDYAEEGWSAARILRHYYPAAKIAALQQPARP